MKRVTIYNITENNQEFKGQRDYVFERYAAPDLRGLQQFPDGEFAVSSVARKVVPVHYLYKFKEVGVRQQYEKIDEKYVVIVPELYEVMDEVVGEKYRSKIDAVEEKCRTYLSVAIDKKKEIDTFNNLPWWKRVRYLFKNL